MKKRSKISQASLKKVMPKKKRRVLFSSKEQRIGFVFFLLVMMTIVWVTYSIVRWMNDPERVVLSKLTITGHRRFTTDGDIQQVIMSLGLPNTFIDQDVDIIQQEILRLPWIKQVSVQKQWPDKLLVHIIEYLPVAYWNNAFLLDKEGMLFDIANKEAVMPLPKLAGPENTQKSVLAMYRHIDNMIKKNKRSDGEEKLTVIAMRVNERYSWMIKVAACQQGNVNNENTLCHNDQDMKIILGREQLEARMKRFMLLYPTIKKQIGTNQQIDIIDLRYSNGASVQCHKLNELSV